MKYKLFKLRKKNVYESITITITYLDETIKQKLQELFDTKVESIEVIYNYIEIHNK